MGLLSTVIGTPISVGFSAGAALAVARPAIGSAPHLLQDFTCTIGGAIAGEVIGGIGTYIVMKTIAGKDSSARFPTALLTVINGAAGIVVGAGVGAITSIAISVFSS